MATSIDDEIFVKIRFLYPSLTKSEKKVADVILDDYEKVCSYTLAEYSEIAGCSDASIMRFCRRLGLGGFLELKQQLSNVNQTAYD